jgi:endonuclease YncB( thermonuclease family)
MPRAPTKPRQTVLGCTLILSLALGGSQAWAFAAVITACHDGDTCSAVTADGQHVRLHGVDAPELDQPFGTQSRALVTQLVVGHHVDVRPAGRSHDRLVADLRLRDGRDVGGLLVAAGAAWVEPGYFPTNPESEVPDRQAAAQRLRLGLWRNASAVPPWEWRHTHGQTFSQEPPARRSWWSRLWSWR